MLPVLDLTALVSTLQTLVVPALGYGLKLLWDIREHLRVLNGRVIKLETWSEGHEELDIERAKALKEKIHECFHGERPK